MRKTVLALLIALSFGTAAQAAEFIVVGSNDPGLKTGAPFLVGLTTLDGLEGFGGGGDCGLDFCVSVGGT